MINWTLRFNRTEYETQRYDFFRRAEERGGVPSLTPYNDNPAVGRRGNMTIGVGFNLEGDPAVRAEVLRAFGLIRDNPALSEEVQAIENEYITSIESAINRMNFIDLHAAMQARANNVTLNVPALGVRRTTFAFNDNQEVRDLFDRLMTTIYEPRVDRWARATPNPIPGGVPDSQERIVLVSLGYNGPLLGPNLRRAITHGDRAEAWYEIRYNSNSEQQDANLRPGIAKRRYYESDTFGLYGDIPPTAA